MPTLTRRPGSVIVAASLVLSLLGTASACSAPPRPDAGTTTTTPAAATTTATVPTVAPPAPSLDPTAGWTRYSDAADHFSLRYPHDWRRRTCRADDHVGLFLAPSNAALAICNSGFTGQMEVIALTGDLRTGLRLDGDGFTTTPVTIDGVTGTRQTATATATETGLGPPAGSRLVSYLFYTAGRTYLCSYAQAPSGATSADVLADFDLMVTGTLRFSAT